MFLWCAQVFEPKICNIKERLDLGADKHLALIPWIISRYRGLPRTALIGQKLVVLLDSLQRSDSTEAKREKSPTNASRLLVLRLNLLPPSTSQLWNEKNSTPSSVQSPAPLSPPPLPSPLLTPSSPSLPAPALKPLASSPSRSSRTFSAPLPSVSSPKSTTSLSSRMHSPCCAPSSDDAVAQTGGTRVPGRSCWTRLRDSGNGMRACLGSWWMAARG